MICDAGNQLAPQDSADVVDIEARLALLEIAPDGLLLLDEQGVVRYANAQSQGLFHYEPDDLVGRHVDAVLPRLAATPSHAGLEPPYSRKNSTSLHARRKGGEEVAVEANISPITLSGGRWTAVALRDARQTRSLEAQVWGLRKGEALGQLAGSVAHDFNNILTAIGSFADLAYQAARSGSSVRANLEEVLAATEQARLLTKKLLDFAKRRPVEPVIVDLNAIVRATERLIDVLMNKSVNVLRALSPHAGLVRIDPGGIEQVLVNLCVNARDAMPHGGTLTLETRTVQLSTEEALRLSPIGAAGTYAVLRVVDSGTGMTDEVKRQVFEPFFSTKPASAGSGLGLATCYGLVTQAGGFMALESELGLGTCVNVYLPRAEPSTATIAASVGNRAILIVEPDANVRVVASRELTQAGFSPIAAKGWVEALDAVRKQSGNLEVLLIDVGLPATDSLELAARIRRLCPSIKTLFMSRHALETLADKGTHFREEEFLQKPFGTLPLLQKLAQLPG